MLASELLTLQSSLCCCYFHILILNAGILRPHSRLRHSGINCLLWTIGLNLSITVTLQKIRLFVLTDCIFGLKPAYTAITSASSLSAVFDWKCQWSCAALGLHCHQYFIMSDGLGCLPQGRTVHMLLLHHTHLHVKGIFQFLMFAFSEIFLKQRKTALESRFQKFHWPSQQKAVDLMALSNHSLYIT